MRRRILALGLVSCVLVAVLIWLAWPWFKRRQADQEAKRPVATALCYLSGTVSQPNSKDKPAKGFESVGNFVRMAFSGSTLDKCQSQILDYCKENVKKGIIPENLLMTFKPNSAETKTNRFKIHANCAAEPTSSSE